MNLKAVSNHRLFYLNEKLLQISISVNSITLIQIDMSLHHHRLNHKQPRKVLFSYLSLHPIPKYFQIGWKLKAQQMRLDERSLPMLPGEHPEDWSRFRQGRIRYSWILSKFVIGLSDRGRLSFR